MVAWCETQEKFIYRESNSPGMKDKVNLFWCN